MVETLEGRALLSAGDLDTTFSGDGKVVTSLPHHTNPAAVAVQADGRILVATTENVTEDRLQAVMLRYRTDGSLDPTFGSGGKVVTSLTDLTFASDLDLTPGGKIVLTMDARTLIRHADGSRSARSGLGLARFNSNGTLDRTFSGDGKAVVNLGTGAETAPVAATLQRDGKIVVAGNNHGSNGTDWFLARLTTSGGLDRTFGTSGRVITGFGAGRDDLVNDVAVGPDGKIVAVGGSGARNGVIARYTSSGRLDTTFSGDGRVFDRSASFTPEFETVHVRSDRKLILSNGWFQTRRINLDGGFDATYGTNGLGSVPLGRSTFVGQGVVGGDGKLYVTGATFPSDPAQKPDFVTVRYLSNGRPDATFGRGGIVRTNVLGYDVGGDVAVAPGNKLVVVGLTNTTEDAPYKIGMVRYRTV